MLSIVTSWVNALQVRRKRSFWIALTFVIITALGMRPSSACLQTAATPMAIVDLELAFDQSKAISIKELWILRECNSAMSISSNAVEAAIINIILDFAFIAAYTWFFIILIVLTKFTSSSPIDNFTMLGCYAALTAGALDINENIFMWVFLTVGEISSLLFAVPAAVKFVILVFLILFLTVRLSMRLLSDRAN